MFASTSSSVLRSELYSTLHDRERRDQRVIGKEDQLKARRYGMCEAANKGRLKYTYSGKVLIWCPRSNRAITSWNLPASERGSLNSGTSNVDPILIQKSETHELFRAERAHRSVTQQMQHLLTKWKSHTVLVVDMSGSMRTDDVDGARCRSDGVWTCLARDFIRRQLEDGKSSLFDLVSVVLMRDTAEVVIECEPTDYVLYNKLVDLREWTNQRPRGPGNYEPALECAEGLLHKNKSGSCAVALFFFSDGKPSDPSKGELPSKMGALASRFGRRLTVTCVGMADSAKEDFSVLERMVQEAKAYGAVASFNKPSMNADSLSQIISSQVSSSLTSTKTELTHLKSGKSLTVRTDLVRERCNAPDDVAPTSDWRLFNNETCYTVNVWTWNSKNEGDGSFCRLADPRCVSCYDVMVMDATTGKAIAANGLLCTGCRTRFFCWDCYSDKRKMAQCHSLATCHSIATLRRQGAIVSPSSERVPSFSVAWKTQVFGEGAERVAYKFRYLDKHGNFHGPKMVAKESRFVDNEGIESGAAKDYLTTNQHQYHQEFMRTQFLASKFANRYNETLQEWEEHLQTLATSSTDPHENQVLLEFVRQAASYPRVRFLQPRIFELVDKRQSKTFNVLVEPMIEGDYRKYNSNNGGILAAGANEHNNMPSPVQECNKELDPTLVKLLVGNQSNSTESIGFSASRVAASRGRAGGDGLGAIVEEEEDSEEEDSEEENFRKPAATVTRSTAHVFERIVQEGDRADRKWSREEIPALDFMQAFSHFSYVRSGGRLIVVDLQGTLKNESDGTCEYILTDPAIHKRKRSQRLRGMRFGRTDRGDKGIEDFFATHVCNKACQLLGVRPYKGRHQRSLLTPTAETPRTNQASARGVTNGPTTSRYYQSKPSATPSYFFND